MIARPGARPARSHLEARRVPIHRLRPGRPDRRPRGPPAAAHRTQDVLPLPGAALHDDARRRGAAAHAADAVGAGRVRRHRADGVQDQEEHHLPAARGQRLHLRDGRHPAVPGQPAGGGRGDRAVPDARVRHRGRGPHRAQAVPRRLDPHRVPAHRDRRGQRSAALRRARDHDHAGERRGGLLPRGLRPRPPDRLAHRPPRHAADRDRDRPRPAHAGGGRGGDPADRPGVPLHRPRARRDRRQPPGRQRLGARRAPRRDQGRAAGEVGAPARARRGGAAGEPARAARRAAPARLHEPRLDRGRERRRDRGVRQLRARLPAAGEVGALGGAGAAPSRVRARQRPVLGPRRTPATPGRHAVVAVAARPHVRPRAGGPGAGDRRPRPAPDPDPLGEVARLPRLVAGAAPGARPAALRGGRRGGGGLGARGRHRHGGRTRSGCATGTPPTGSRTRPGSRSPTARPTSSASSPVPTVCTPTPTRLRPA